MIDEFIKLAGLLAFIWNIIQFLINRYIKHKDDKITHLKKIIDDNFISKEILPKLNDITNNSILKIKTTNNHKKICTSYCAKMFNIINQISLLRIIAEKEINELELAMDNLEDEIITLSHEIETATDNTNNEALQNEIKHQMFKNYIRITITLSEVISQLTPNNIKTLKLNL